jgi:ribonuclease J
MIEVKTVGGYSEVGKNCTAIKIGDEAVIFDLGIQLENYIRLTEDEDIQNISTHELVKAGALPDLRTIDSWKDLVVAVVPTHAHLDHIGAIPYLSDEFYAPIIGTPYTAAVIRAILDNNNKILKNRIVALNPNSGMKITDDISVEFINITHSTPQTAIAAIHTKEGTILYANDFKIDNNPQIGLKPNFERLKEIAKNGVKLLIIDSLYAEYARKTPSEEVAKSMLKDVLLSTNSKGNAIFVTTFSSHIARLKSIIEVSRKLNRKVIFLGRSLSKYVTAAEDVGIVKFSDDVEILGFGRQVRRRLKELSARKGEYVIVCTGHQGEKEAVLSKIAKDKLHFKFEKEDIIVFSCTVIPSPTNIANRKELEEELIEKGLRIFKDVHVSGHGSREDLREMIKLVNPEYIIPAHSNLPGEKALAELAYEMGYSKDKVFVLKNNQKVEIR